MLEKDTQIHMQGMPKMYKLNIKYYIIMIISIISVQFNIFTQPLSSSDKYFLHHLNLVLMGD